VRHHLPARERDGNADYFSCHYQNERGSVGTVSRDRAADISANGRVNEVRYQARGEVKQRRHGQGSEARDGPGKDLIRQYHQNSDRSVSGNRRQDIP